MELSISVDRAENGARKESKRRTADESPSLREVLFPTEFSGAQRAAPIFEAVEMGQDEWCGYDLSAVGVWVSHEPLRIPPGSPAAPFCVKVMARAASETRDSKPLEIRKITDILHRPWTPNRFAITDL